MTELLEADERGVLVAEDDPANQLVIRRMLSRLGLRVDLVTDGEAALERLVAAPQAYGLVLMDIQMPRMSGPEATWLIRSRLGLARLPVVVMSADLSPVVCERCRSLGTTDFLEKPIHLDVLASLVERYLGLHAPVPPSLPKVQPPVGETAIGTAARQAALARMGNDAALYAACLRAFVERYAGVCEEIRDLSMAARREEAMRVAHALKGAARTLGAEWLAERAEQLHDALARQDGDDEVAQRLGALAPVLEAAVQASRTIIEESAGAAA